MKFIKEDQIEQIRNTYGESAFYNRMQNFSPVPYTQARLVSKKLVNGKNIAERLQAATLGDNTESRRAVDAQKRKDWINKQKAEGKIDRNEMFDHYSINEHGQWEHELI